VAEKKQRTIRASGATRGVERKFKIMSNKHPKLDRPNNVDLVRNPLIGGSKGVTMAQATPEDLEALVGENTIEGDVENDTNPQGGVDKAEAQGDKRDGPPRRDRSGPSRRRPLQGQKTHAQQLRILERKPDLPARPAKRQADGEHPETGTRIKGKGAGAGAMTDLQDELVGENDVLSNRDKVQESGERGQDGKWIQTEQLEDHAANKGRG
jgi:hypothetical protein